MNKPEIYQLKTIHWLWKRKLGLRIAINHRRSHLRGAAFYVLMTFFTLAVMEVFSALFFHYTSDRFVFYDFDNYVVPAGQTSKLSKYYDREIGWVNRYDTKYGERPRPVKYEKDIMAAYGDSYTYCNQVTDSETWQTYLSEMIGKNVYNFGVGGYGTDQAYLLFKRNLPRVRTKLVTLALIQENICRTLNVYRPFYFPKTKGTITKPHFTLSDGGELVLVENPIRSERELEKLSDPGFIRKIGADDYWYNQGGYPTLSFPYMSIFFNGHFWNEVRALLGEKVIDDITPRPSNHNSLWKSGHSRLMFSLFDRFAEETAAAGSTPVIFVIPTIDDSMARLRTGQNPESFDIIINYCKTMGYNVYNGLDGVMAIAKTEGDIRSLYIGHFSGKGNRALARGFFGYLKSNGLI